jgi:biotin carboxyl carrier protein
MYKVNINKFESELSVLVKGDKFLVDEQHLDWDVFSIDKNSFQIIHKNKTFTAHIVNIDYDTKEFTFQVNGKIITLKLKDKMDILLEELGMSDLAQVKINEVRAPMPGLISEILVKEGEEVKQGASLIILEAMKMENVIKSPGDGVISEIKVQKGSSVEKNQILIQF